MKIGKKYAILDEEKTHNIQKCISESINNTTDTVDLNSGTAG